MADKLAPLPSTAALIVLYTDTAPQYLARIRAKQANNRNRAMRLARHARWTEDRERFVWTARAGHRLWRALVLIQQDEKARARQVAHV
jgi:hypothetical protein